MTQIVSLVAEHAIWKIWPMTTHNWIFQVSCITSTWVGTMGFLHERQNYSWTVCSRVSLRIIILVHLPPLLSALTCPHLQSVKLDDLCQNFQAHEALDSDLPVVTATLANDGSIVAMTVESSGDAGVIPVTVPTASVDNVRFVLFCLCVRFCFALFSHFYWFMFWCCPLFFKIIDVVFSLSYTRSTWSWPLWIILSYLFFLIILQQLLGYFSPCA